MSRYFTVVRKACRITARQHYNTPKTTTYTVIFKLTAAICQYVH